MLGNNDAEYNKYFAWKETHMCTELPALRSACQLYRCVQRERNRKQIVVQFWGRNTNCISAKQFYHGIIGV